MLIIDRSTPIQTKATNPFDLNRRNGRINNRGSKRTASGFAKPSSKIIPVRAQIFQDRTGVSWSKKMNSVIPTNKKQAAFVNPSAFKVEAWKSAAGESAKTVNTHFPTGSKRMVKYAPAR